MNTKLTLITVAVAMTLTACGGGGTTTAIPAVANGSTSPATTTNPATPVTPSAPVVVAPNQQTTVAAATYLVGSNELNYFNTLNTFRAQLGLGLYAQNAKLDIAAKNHAAYVATYASYNGGPVSMFENDIKTGVLNYHIEDAARAGFTGITSTDRAKAAMYDSAFVNEEGGGGINLVQGLINTVFHRLGLMDQSQRDIGISFANDSLNTAVANIGLAKGASAQFAGSDYFGVYPSDKQTGILLSMSLEAPNPFPEISYSEYSAKTSYPISVSSEKSTTLAVKTFTVTESGQTTPLNARLMTKTSTDLTAVYLSNNVAFLIGYAPFKAKTTYNVSFTGTVNGVDKIKTWSFTTI